MRPSVFAATPSPPYVAVVFTSLRTNGSGDEADDGYDETSDRMEELAASQPGYLGIESARGADGGGITVSYWADDDAARAWKRVAEHAEAQRMGRERWYAGYRVRVARVEREYGFEA
jgi:heme-degrading monooxygenase HmoA